MNTTHLKTMDLLRLLDKYEVSFWFDFSKLIISTNNLSAEETVRVVGAFCSTFDMGLNSQEVTYKTSGTEWKPSVEPVWIIDLSYYTEELEDQNAE